jgi:class 3 adenylate cyclase
MPQALAAIRPVVAEQAVEGKPEVAGPLLRDDRHPRPPRPYPADPAPGRPQEKRRAAARATELSRASTRTATAAGLEQPAAHAVDETLFDFMGVPTLARPSADAPSRDSRKIPPSAPQEPDDGPQRTAEQASKIPPLSAARAPAFPHANLGEIVAGVSPGLEDDLVSALARALSARQTDGFATAHAETLQTPPDVVDWQTTTAPGHVFARAFEGLNHLGDAAAWSERAAGVLAAPQAGLPVSAAPAPRGQRAGRPAREDRQAVRLTVRTGDSDRDGSTALVDTVPDSWTDGPQSELQTALFRALRQVRELEMRQASYNQFFSPVIRHALRDSDPELLLSPREAEVTVLFGDLRGFSRQAEKHALAPFLESVSQALGVMTRGIREQEGVIGDFHGDATMGFWGWPSPQPDRAARAARTALSIRSLFAETGPAATPFRAGVGIASGRAIAGKIGTAEQVKVTVFGPVVNLASRLEGMTKIFGVAVLLDEATAQRVRESIGPEEARLRRLAVVLPYGMDRALTVSELLPPARDLPSIADDHLAQYEAGLTAFLAGDWRAAYRILADLPPHDQAPEFLLNHMVERQFTPPIDWDGVIRLDSK